MNAFVFQMKKNVYIDMLNSICVEVRVHGLLNCMLTTLI